MSQTGFAQGTSMLKSPIGKLFFTQDEKGTYVFKEDLDADSASTKSPRMAAIALDITLGVFGAHRLYLGTDVKVPVFYTLTVGGGMLLWIVDLGCLIFTKDISRYCNNPNVFMWIPPKEKD
jgi:TM2 domain-containing membrane protein YozV